MRVQDIPHLHPGRKGSKNALSRDRQGSSFRCSREGVSPVAPERSRGDDDPTEHVAGSHRVDGDDVRRRHPEHAISRDKGGAVGPEGQNNRACPLPAQLPRGLFRFAAPKVDRLAAVDEPRSITLQS